MSFDINNGVSHEQFGDGIVVCGWGDGMVMVKFDDGIIRNVKEDELTSNPSKGLYRNFNRGKRQYGVFSKKGSRQHEV